MGLKNRNFIIASILVEQNKYFVKNESYLSSDEAVTVYVFVDEENRLLIVHMGMKNRNFILATVLVFHSGY